MIAIDNQITEFISTNAVNPTTEYNPATTYIVDDNARYENYVYKSVQDPNLGNLPTETLYKSWIEWDPANDYAMLDYFRETETEFPSDSDGVVIFERGYKEALLIAQFNSEEITIEYLDDTNTVIDANDTETHDFGTIMTKYDIYTYITAPFTYDETQVLYRPIKRIGTRVRVTFKRAANSNTCGVFFAGSVTDFGTTLDKVNLSGVKYGKIEARKADFNTIIEKGELMQNLERSRVASNSILAFVIDPSETTAHNNIVIIGKLDVYSGTAENASKNTMSFSIEQNVRK